jgi:hypothetical protein
MAIAESSRISGTWGGAVLVVGMATESLNGNWKIGAAVALTWLRAVNYEFYAIFEFTQKQVIARSSGRKLRVKVHRSC